MTDTPTTAVAVVAELGMAPATQPTPTTALVTPAQAAARLRELEADRQWGDKLYRGDAQVRQEFTDLTTIAASGDPLDAIMAGVQPTTIDVDETGGGKARAVDQIAAVADLRERGIPDQAIRDLLGDVRPTYEQHVFGKEMQRRNFANPEWVERLLAGDPRANQDFISNSWAIGCYEESP
jgi:hypothetical protein